MDRDELLKRLTILDFMATDLALYLDTHAEEQEALRIYNKIVCDADKLRKKYEMYFGPINI